MFSWHFGFLLSLRLIDTRQPIAVIGVHNEVRSVIRCELNESLHGGREIRRLVIYQKKKKKMLPPTGILKSFSLIRITYRRAHGLRVASCELDC